MIDFRPNSIYSVFFDVIKLHYKRSQEILDSIGIYPGQPPVLIVLTYSDGLSQRELSDKIRIKPATMTVMLGRMEKAGLVVRKSDPNDQRISRVYITDKGREVKKEFDKVFQQIEEECFSNFTEEEKILLRRLLMQMRDNLLNKCDKKENTKY